MIDLVLALCDLLRLASNGFCQIRILFFPFPLNHVLNVKCNCNVCGLSLEVMALELRLWALYLLLHQEL
jgi:hypothetical protein